MTADRGEAASRAVLGLLTARGETVAAAESLTGGLVVAALVSVPGASAALRGGVVAYATELKHTLLGVDRDLLAAVGAVHPDVAAAMAAGVRERLGSTWAVATTGVAGPDPQDGVPVGTVDLGVAGPHGVITRRLELDGSRGAIRAAATEGALQLLLDCMRAEPRSSVVGDPRAT